MTATKPTMASAHIQVLAGSLDGDDMTRRRDSLRRELLAVAYDAAITDGGVGIRNATDLRIIDAPGETAAAQSAENRNAEREAREPFQVPPLAVAFVDAHIVWPEEAQ